MRRFGGESEYTDDAGRLWVLEWSWSTPRAATRIEPAEGGLSADDWYCDGAHISTDDVPADVRQQLLEDADRQAFEMREVA